MSVQPAACHVLELLHRARVKRHALQSELCRCQGSPLLQDWFICMPAVMCISRSTHGDTCLNTQSVMAGCLTIKRRSGSGPTHKDH